MVAGMLALVTEPNNGKVSYADGPCPLLGMLSAKLALPLNLHLEL
jgi:hypothetical protein